MRSLRGIYYNLEDSEYRYKAEGLEFYFSSKLYMEKFINEINDYCALQIYKLQKLLPNLWIEKRIFYVDLYKKIEKRGYFIIDTTNNLLFRNKTIVVSYGD